MSNQIKKKKQEIFQVFGINGAYNIIKAKSVTIVSIEIMLNGIAAKKKWVNNLINSQIKAIHKIPKGKFLKKYYGKRTQGIVVSFEGNIIKPIPSFINDHHNTCLLAMDNIEDPQNLGQIIRTAECAGIDGILMPQYGNARLTNTVFQVSQGAFIHLPLYHCGNLHQQLKMLKKEGFWIIGVENSIQAKSWFSQDYNCKVVLVLGSEGKGIRPIILKVCDDLITIPMKGKINSLNVSASVSAVLFERQRQILQTTTN